MTAVAAPGSPADRLGRYWRASVARSWRRQWSAAGRWWLRRLGVASDSTTSASENVSRHDVAMVLGSRLFPLVEGQVDLAPGEALGARARLSQPGREELQLLRLDLPGPSGAGEQATAAAADGSLSVIDEPGSTL